MVTHRLFASYTYISLANSKCWPVMILFYFTGQLNVLAFHDSFLLLFSSFIAGQLNVLASLFFLRGQLNVLACHDIARWMSSAPVTRLPTCSGNTY